MSYYENTETAFNQNPHVEDIDTITMEKMLVNTLNMNGGSNSKHRDLVLPTVSFGGYGKNVRIEREGNIIHIRGLDIMEGGNQEKDDEYIEHLYISDKSQRGGMDGDEELEEEDQYENKYDAVKNYLDSAFQDKYGMSETSAYTGTNIDVGGFSATSPYRVSDKPGNTTVGMSATSVGGFTDINDMSTSGMSDTSEGSDTRENLTGSVFSNISTDISGTETSSDNLTVLRGYNPSVTSPVDSREDYPDEPEDEPQPERDESEPEQYNSDGSYKSKYDSVTSEYHMDTINRNIAEN